MDDHPPPLAVYARRVSKTYGKGVSAVHALREVDFDARLGEMLMIVGPSGCGKTTLLSIIAGTLSFDTGEVDVFGQSLHQMDQRAITAFRRKNVGFIFQQYHLIPTINCLENVQIPMLLNGYGKKEAEEAAATILDKVGLKGREKESIYNLSGGQQQRVAIARGLVHSPRLVICDEPTAALDAETGSTIMQLMKSAAQDQARCVIVVTHDNRIFQFADRLAKMDDGRMTAIISNPDERG